MSVLSFPRVNFRGVFSCNPVTSNNDDVMAAMVERDLDAPGTTMSGMTDAQARAYLRESVVMANSSSAPCRTYIRSGWNLYGDYHTSFDSAVVTSVVRGPTAAERAMSSAADMLVGMPVQILGGATEDRRGTAMMCDLDATGLVTTQVFLGGLQIGPDASGTSGTSLVLDHDTRCFQNWLNFFSTVGPYGGEQNFIGIGCVWQFAIPKDRIPSTVGLASPGLQALLAAARAAEGLAVRFRCFEVEPQLTSEMLAAQYAAGGAPPNPATGYLIGTIGVWESGEPETETAGRKLTAPYPRSAMTYAGAPSSGWPLPGGPAPWQAPPSLVGNAVAQVNGSLGIVSLDLIGTFPKNGFRHPNGPDASGADGFDVPKQKADLGPLQLAIAPPDVSAATTVVANLDYGVADYASYEDFGGIVDVPYDASLGPALAAGLLVVQSAPGNTVNPNVTLLQETPIRVVTDDRTLYLARGTTPAPPPVRLKVYDRGGPTRADVTLHLYEYFNVIQPQFAPTCDGAEQDGVRPNQTVALDPRGLLRYPRQVTIPAGEGYADWFPVPIHVAGSGATILSYQLDPTVYGTGNPVPGIGPGPVAGVPTWSYATYSAVRIFAHEDYVALTANGPLRWPDVYAAVLQYYALLFPQMSTYIQLDSEEAVVGNAAALRSRLHTPAEPGFYTTYNMPPTRSMSPSKVKLLRAFLDQQTKSG